MASEVSRKYQEEILRLLSEIVAELKESNILLKEHNSAIDSIKNRIRKIGFSTTNWR
ncbi:hypothetical protein Ngar_c26560 [Candidatus Nitrososphaera gargensis Ga9.2]|uniref:Uncharacterized protein n=1 Tax=Nitrososphaera gargensis (strain Ga9.2) TaxID=1237085 RepID=K0ILN2_NITGG|nr:hypothetical protein [Candidatus Nitrososphaera gargensis]AFU59577.1 hypothetical protein Ngar_c26560 [Candidatus Nitrososphaera gargensis Ga9.2]